MQLIKFHGTDYGYCEQCDRPALVALLELNGWKHGFRICERCLGQLTTQARERTTG